MFKKILVPTDGSPVSEKSAKAAIEFAAINKACIVVLSVAQSYPYLLMPEAGAMLDLSIFEEAQDQAAQANATKIKILAEDAKVDFEIVVTRGTHPYEEIITTANDKHCDVIWIASHGRRGLDKLLLGSETQRVLAHSVLPVVVYR
jgi:nucleotide-binding universal stress UspA family protein